MVEDMMVLTPENLKKLKLQAANGSANEKYWVYFCMYTLYRNTPEGDKWLIQAADEGCHNAIRVLADRLATGDGIKKDREKAIEYLRRAAYPNVNKSDNEIRLSESDDEIVIADFLESQEQLDDDPEAETMLGKLLLEDESTLDEGLRLLSSAEMAGENEARLVLGEWFLNNSSKPQEIQRGKYLLIEAAQKNDEFSFSANLSLARHYKSGTFGQKNSKMAVKHFKSALKSKEWQIRAFKAELIGKEKTEKYNSELLGFKANLEYLIGYEFFSSFQSFEDLNESLKWFRKAEKHGCLKSKLKIAELYRTLYDDPSEKIFKEAVTKLDEAWDGGLIESYAILGRIYSDGWFVKPDRQKASEYYTKAAERGSQEANFELGLAAFYGKKGDCNHKEAERYFKAALPDGRAAFYLGRIRLGIEDGYKILKNADRNVIKAREFFETSYSNGCTEAGFYTAVLDLSVFKVTSFAERFKALRRLSIAANEGVFEASEILGLWIIKQISSNSEKKKLRRKYLALMHLRTAIKQRLLRAFLPDLNPKEHLECPWCNLFLVKKNYPVLVEELALQKKQLSEFKGKKTSSKMLMHLKKYEPNWLVTHRLYGLMKVITGFFQVEAVIKGDSQRDFLSDSFWNFQTTTDELVDPIFANHVGLLSKALIHMDDRFGEKNESLAEDCFKQIISAWMSINKQKKRQTRRKKGFRKASARNTEVRKGENLTVNSILKWDIDFLNWAAMIAQGHLQRITEVKVRLEERNRIVKNQSHNIKNILRSVQNTLELLQKKHEDPIISEAIKGTAVISAMANAISLSYTGTTDDFYYDAKTQLSGMSLSKIFQLAIETSIGNILKNRRYYQTFFEAYFNDSSQYQQALSEYDEQVCIRNENWITSLINYLERHFFDFELSIDPLNDLTIGGQKGSHIKLLCLITEVIFNAVKYAGFVERKKRFLKVVATKTSERILILVENSFQPSEAKTSGSGSLIVENLVKVMNGRLSCKRGEQMAYQVAIELPNFWEEATHG